MRMKVWPLTSTHWSFKPGGWRRRQCALIFACIAGAAPIASAAPSRTLPPIDPVRDLRVELVDVSERTEERAVGLLRAVGDDSSQRCTGTAVAPFYVLTAAHCVLDEAGGPRRNVYFYPAYRQGHVASFGRFPASQVFLPAGYNRSDMTTGGISRDIALVRVDPNHAGDSLATFAGVLPFQGLDSLPSSRMSTVGYPSDKPSYSAYAQRRCTVREFGDILLQSACFVEKGQSGSPVLIHRPDAFGYVVYGVLTGRSGKRNFATPITPQRAYVLQTILETGRLPQGASDDVHEAWRTFPVATSPAITLFVENTCFEPIMVAYSTYEGSGQWRTRGYYQVEPRQIRELVRSADKRYRLHIHNKHTRRLLQPWGEVLQQVPGSPGTSRFKDYDAEQFGDIMHTPLGC
jgi:V8-like Glu-specific endopeptidase